MYQVDCGSNIQYKILFSGLLGPGIKFGAVDAIGLCLYLAVTVDRAMFLFVFFFVVRAEMLGFFSCLGLYSFTRTLHICYSLFCLILVQAARTFLSIDGDDLVQKEVDTTDSSTRFKNQYLNKAISILSSNILNGELFCKFTLVCSF
jgi:hypothetical protein